jgi:paraquat-inducible protein A
MNEPVELMQANPAEQVDERIACSSCDLLLDLSGLADGETARCSRCGNFLTTYNANLVDRLQSYSLAAIIMLLLACTFPFMSFSRSGLASEMTLPQTAIVLWTNDMPILSLLVGAFIILVPAALLLLVQILSLLLKRRRPSAWPARIGRFLFALEIWSMVEVFLVGVLVSLVKIAKMATVVLGISFWAYAAFSILFTLTLVNLDRYQCWKRIEALSPS